MGVPSSRFMDSQISRTTILLQAREQRVIRCLGCGKSLACFVNGWHVAVAGISEFPCEDGEITCRGECCGQAVIDGFARFPQFVEVMSLTVGTVVGCEKTFEGFSQRLADNGTARPR